MKKQYLLNLLVLSLIMSGFFTSAHAKPITDPSQLGPGFTLIDFEDATGFANPYITNGVTFTSVTGSLIRFDISQWPANGTEIEGIALFPGAEPDSAIRITFANPIAQFLLGWGDPNFEGNILQAYNTNGNLLEQASVSLGPPGGGHAAWIGFTRTQADIASILVQPDQSRPSGDDYVIDNIHYNTHAVPVGVPNCSPAQAFPSVLWSPKHQFVPIVVMGVTDPDGDAVIITVTGVTQDEPVNAKGDGNTSPDAVIEAGAALVRAERSGNGNGRVYQISFRAEDSKSGVCTGAVTVGVPHSLKNGLTAIDDGQVYDSTVR